MDRIIKCEKFCVLCGQTRDVNKPEYKIKKLLLQENTEIHDLGVLCDKCNKCLEDGRVFLRN